ncbi:MAG: Holliday junction resolvase RuvX [Buchnera aphidicola (Kaburagia rhusicola rhusicola)]
MIMIIIAFDFGTKRIGVAVGQNITKTAQILPSIKVKNKKIDLTKFNTLFREWKPCLIVIGLPLNMDGTKQDITKKSEQFAKQLFSHFKIPVHLHDERLTTIEAKTILFEMNGFKHFEQNKIDSTSAAIILESWLSNNENILKFYIKKLM